MISVAGAIDVEAVVAARLASASPGSAAPAGVAGPPRRLPTPAATRREIRTRARDQAHLFVGHLTVARAHPDYPALELAERGARLRRPG